MTDIITMGETLYVFSSTRFNLVTVNTVSGGSPFNPFARSDGPSYECWQTDLTFRARKADDLDELRRFIMKLRGGKVLARIYDHSRTALNGMTQPRGAGGSTSTINVQAAAVAGAESITVKNLTPSQAVALKALDHLGIGENLYAVEDSSPSDAGGLSTVTIRPPLRMGIAVDDPVNLVKPTGLFRLTAGGTDVAIHARAQISEGVTLSFIEEPEFV